MSHATEIPEIDATLKAAADFSPRSMNKTKKEEIRHLIRARLLDSFREMSAPDFPLEAAEAACEFDAPDEELRLYAKLLDEKAEVDFEKLDSANLGNLLSLFGLSMADVVDYKTLHSSKYKDAWFEDAYKNMFALAAGGRSKKMKSNVANELPPQVRIYLNERTLDLVTD